ncbi:MAG: histone deacetylase family protein [Hyphomicrobiales bacterium]
MKAVFSETQFSHAPEQFMAKGKLVPHPEQPERANRLLAGVEKAGLSISAPDTFGDEHILALHPERYVQFLRDGLNEWRSLDDAADYMVPNVHPVELPAEYPDHIVGRAGWHQADLAASIGAGSWAAIRASADTALTVAELVASGKEVSAYALCRPPGHHAFSERAGGFCFLANSGLAAQYLRNTHEKVAILDVDVHHGNGTQGIFYDRGDVFTVSIHADPSTYYPYFWGYAQENGAGEGERANLNLPVPVKSGDEVWLNAVDKACEAIVASGATALVIALGLDAHEADPLLGGDVTTEGFAKIAARIAQLSLPAAIIQEGGYLTNHLGDNLASFLLGYGS